MSDDDKTQRGPRAGISTVRGVGVGSAESTGGSGSDPRIRVPTPPRGNDTFDPHVELPPARATPERIDAKQVIKRVRTLAPVPPPDELPRPEYVRDGAHAAIDDAAKTARRAATPDVDTPERDRPPIEAISMRTPGRERHVSEPRSLPGVRLRPISEVQPPPPEAHGRLAPPRDPDETRSRHRRDMVVWASIALIVGSLVTLAIFLAAR